MGRLASGVLLIGHTQCLRHQLKSLSLKSGNAGMMNLLTASEHFTRHISEFLQ